ncbi:MAG TPA: hypothetical protein VMS78_11835 [Rhizomicrobium sp.]|nr:hypothetical protein [Rhizomicrobium sp.]
MHPETLIAISGFIVLAMGTGHLFLTLFTDKMDPRDRELSARMKEVSPRLTRRTTMWNLHIGFNASHSYGPMIFGAIYAWLALVHPSFLMQSNFLLAFGAVVFAAYLFLAIRYWFWAPLTGLSIAAAFYAAGIAIMHVQL